MDYKEKYNKLVEAIKVLQETNPTDEGIQNWVNDNVPELHESESWDEKIRKELIKVFSNREKYLIDQSFGDITVSEVLTWLEKQKPEVNVTKFKPGDKVTNGISTYTIDSIEGDHYRCKDGVNITFNLEYRWKLVENTQKSETAFHEGDWIVQENIGVYKVIEVCESWYEVIDIEDNHYSIGFDKEYMCHLWSIEDVKPGDILSNGKMIVIFKKFEEPLYKQHIIAYIGLDNFGRIQITNEYWELGIDKAKPATKEQQDFLFQKMKEYGHIWDAEKKELNEIHIIDEGKAEMDYCFTKMMNEEKVTLTLGEDELQLKEGNFYKCIKSYHHLCGNEYWFDEGKVYFCEKDGYLRSDHNNLINIYDCKNWQSYFCLYTGKPKQPKFNIGDWCIDNEDGTIFQIVKVLDNTYIYKTIEGKEYSCTHYSLENDARLWSIKDAKPGDIIAEEPIETYPSSFVAIYKKQNEEDFDSYCFIGFDGKFYKGEEGHTLENLHPATKEQRDFLFQKMKEADYKWNDKKKELKKIDWNDYIKYNPNAPSIIKESNWDDVDEADLNNIIWLCNNCINGSETTWIPSQAIRIKSLIERIKNTVFLQLKQEWSEEDEAKLKSACALIRNTNLNGNEDIVNSTIEWIKSLRFRNMWISIDEEVYVKEPVLAQKKDKSDPFGGFVVCCDHMLTPNIYERYMILGNS